MFIRQGEDPANLVRRNLPCIFQTKLAKDAARLGASLKQQSLPHPLLPKYKGAGEPIVFPEKSGKKQNHSFDEISQLFFKVS